MNSDFRFEITVIFYHSPLHINILWHNFRLNIWQFKQIFWIKIKTRFKDHFHAEVVVTHLNLDLMQKNSRLKCVYLCVFLDSGSHVITRRSRVKVRTKGELHWNKQYCNWTILLKSTSFNLVLFFQTRLYIGAIKLIYFVVKSYNYNCAT